MGWNSDDLIYLRFTGSHDQADFFIVDISMHDFKLPTNTNGDPDPHASPEAVNYMEIFNNAFRELAKTEAERQKKEGEPSRKISNAGLKRRP